MLLAVDIGNSQTVFGLFSGSDLRFCWRISTGRHRTADETWLLLGGLLDQAGVEAREIHSAIGCSVVPVCATVFSRACHTHLGVVPRFVGPDLHADLVLAVDNPSEVGADRIVNAVAARHLAGDPCIVVDLGTAITFDVVDRQGRYRGGAIAPGLGLSLDALFARTAQLPRVDLAPPPSCIGANTVHSIQSGVLFGAVAMVDGLATRIRAELGAPNAAVLATGGYAGLLAESSITISRVEPDLTLLGLRLIDDQNRADAVVLAR